MCGFFQKNQNNLKNLQTEIETVTYIDTYTYLQSTVPLGSDGSKGENLEDDKTMKDTHRLLPNKDCENMSSGSLASLAAWFGKWNWLQPSFPESSVFLEGASFFVCVFFHPFFP